MSSDELVKNWIERIVFLPMRLRHRAQARPKNKARAKALVEVQNTLQKATHLGLGNMKVVFNVGLYLLLLDQDLAEFTNDLVHGNGDRRRAFIAKHEAVLLYEAAEDLPQLMGRNFRNAVSALGVSQEQLGRLNSASSGLSKFRREHQGFLGTIRNVLAAHRDHDALRYIESLELLKPLEVMAVGAELSAQLRRLMDVLIEVALLTSKPINILRDIAASGQQGDA